MRTDLGRYLQVIFQNVGDNDPVRAEDAKPLHDHQTDGSRAQYDCSLSTLEISQCQHMPCNGRGLDQRGIFKGQGIRQDEDILFGQVNKFGKAARLARTNEGIIVTGRVISSLTFFAFKTRHKWNNGSMLANIALADPIANAINYTGIFMSEDERIHSMPVHVALDVRATDRNGFDL